MNRIVETALRLLTTHPNAPALEILDQAMKGHKNSSPEFESVDPLTGLSPHPAYSDDTDAFSPFGELLRRAFAPELDPREVMLLNPIEPFVSEETRTRITQVSDAWQQVIEKFADRYNLWTG
jgi:hypothetical protein